MASFIYTDTNDILEHNLKQILTLLWQLIMHYQVTEANEESKLLLLEWMNATLPDQNITNFTTDWNDGINLSALVDYCKPGLIPNHPFLEPSNAIENITKAMALAEEHLGIPQIMQPDDFAAEKPDEQSVMTYLSLFCDPTSPEVRQLNLVCPQKSGKIAQGYEKESTFDDVEIQHFTLPLEDRYKLSISSDGTEVSGSSFFNLGKPDASKCRVVTPLIMSGLTNKIFSSSNTAIYTVNREVCFEIDTADAGRGSLSVTATTQEGEAQTSYIEPIPERPEVFKVSYTPATPGTHTLNLLWADEALPSSPMSFEVMDATLLPFGIPILINMTANCRKRNMKAYAVYQGKDVQYKMKIDKLDKGHFHLSFKPKDEGIYYIHVLNEGKELPRSPLTVWCTKEVKAGSSTDSHIDFVVDSLEAELENQLSGMTHSSSVSTIGSTNVPESASLSPESITLTSTHENNSVPSERHTFPKMAGKKLLPLQSKWGALKGAVTGLNFKDEKFRVGVPHSFKLHCEDLGQGMPDIACKPPDGAKISMSPAPGDNSYLVEILPKKAGKYELTAKFNGKHILGSPFHVQFTTCSDASKCILEDSPPECQKMSTGTQNVIFCVSNKGAGKGKLRALVKSIATKEVVPITITRPFKHHFHIEFNPSEGLDYTLAITYDDINIPGSPFKLALGDASKCRMEGEGIIEAWLHEENWFRVNTEEAGPGQLNVLVEGANENVEPDIFMPAEGTFDVAYQPTRCGLYSIAVRWGKQDIPGSPFEVNCCRKVPQRSNYFAITWLPGQRSNYFEILFVHNGEKIVVVISIPLQCVYFTVTDVR